MIPTLVKDTKRQSRLNLYNAVYETHYRIMSRDSERARHEMAEMKRASFCDHMRWLKINKKWDHVWEEVLNGCLSNL